MEQQAGSRRGRVRLRRTSFAKRTNSGPFHDPYLHRPLPTPSKQRKPAGIGGDEHSFPLPAQACHSLQQCVILTKVVPCTYYRLIFTHKPPSASAWSLLKREGDQSEALRIPCLYNLAWNLEFRNNTPTTQTTLQKTLSHIIHGHRSRFRD